MGSILHCQSVRHPLPAAAVRHSQLAARDLNGWGPPLTSSETPRLRSQWAVDQGIAIEDKVAIYGGSYGGYACLAGLAFTPDVYACGVDIVGPSNVKTLLDSIPPYWGPLRNDMLKKIGDVDGDAAFNESISPLFHVDSISKPLLVSFEMAPNPRHTHSSILSD